MSERSIATDHRLVSDEDCLSRIIEFERPPITDPGDTAGDEVIFVGGYRVKTFILSNGPCRAARLGDRGEGEEGADGRGEEKTGAHTIRLKSAEGCHARPVPASLLLVNDVYRNRLRPQPIQISLQNRPDRPKLRIESSGILVIAVALDANDPRCQ